MPRYSKHAWDRMRQRGIEKEWVEMCLEKPDVVLSPTKGLKQHILNLPDGRRLKVVIDADKNMVVSAMWL